MAESMGLEGRPHPYLRRGDVLDVPTSGRGHLPYPPSGRALYAQRVVTRPRQGLPWSPSDLARAPLLGGHFTALPFCGFALARHRPEEREQCLYHSGRAPLARFALPDEILLTVFDALVPAATWRPEKPVPDAFCTLQLARGALKDARGAVSRRAERGEARLMPRGRAPPSASRSFFGRRSSPRSSAWTGSWRCRRPSCSPRPRWSPSRRGSSRSP